MWSNQENRVRKQVKNPCEARKIKASQILHKIISTHLLTVLIIGAIVQLEQRKRDKNQRYEADSIHTGFRITIPEVPAINTSEFSDRAKYIIYHLEGDMTYDDA